MPGQQLLLEGQGRFEVRPGLADGLPALLREFEQIFTGKGLNRHIRHGAARQYTNRDLGIMSP